MIKEGILDIFYIWKDELKNVFKDEGELIFSVALFLYL